MNRATINYMLDGLLLVNILIVFWISAVTDWLFPTPEASAGWTLWGMGLGRWLGIRFISLFIFMILALIHVMLHWKWVFSMTTQLIGRITKHKIVIDGAHETLLGVAFLVGILHVFGILYLVAMFSLKAPIASR